jgi:uncharacterized protein YrrD/pyrimidine deaminase RibD-like protein
MYKGRDVIGKPVVSYDMGEKFDIVEDLIFDQDSNQLLGFLVNESGWFSSAQVLLLKDVQAIGLDAVITTSKNAITKASEIPAISHILEHNNILKGTRILTMDGRDLGIMIDLYFDERTGVVEGYEVSGGLFADAYSGRSFVPAPQTLKIGRDVAFVPTQTAQLMEEQVGGIKGAMQTASNKVQETAQVTGDKIQEFGRIASEKAQETAQVTGDKIQEFGQIASDKAQETAQVTGDKLQEFGRSATTSISNAIVDPEEQKAFAIGKTAEYDVVVAHGGQSLVLQGQIVTPAIAASAEDLGVLDDLYRATGGSLSDKLGERVGNAVASLTIEQAQGRRVQQIVRTDGGSIIAAPGQIVTEQVIKRAKTYHQEQALLKAVGLSRGEAVRDSTSSAMSGAGDRLKSTTQNTGEQLQAGAKGLWAQVKDTASEIQDRGTQAIEEKRIKGALGRPVTRVILDRYDDVILNVGELITHQAIASARQSQVLDVLLDSVYSEKPQLSLENLRAPQAGRDAL